VVGHEELAEAAARQQRVRIEGADSRGIIYDRNGQPLTGVNREYVYIINKSKATDKALAMIEDMGGRRLSNYNDRYYVYTVSSYDNDATKNLQAECGAYVMEAERRYENEQTAVHLIGYVNQKDAVGVSGIELMFDEQLSQRNKNLYALADNKGNLLAGSGLYKVAADSGNDIGITTTLDGQLQKQVEEIIEKSPYNGGVVVLERKSGEILAAASTPVFNPNVVKDYIDSNDNELMNKVTQGEYPPGSIFKIVVATAALEYGVNDEQGNRITLSSKFTCAGAETLYGISIGCSTGGESGHGEITLKDAFAKSCNCAFIQLGQLVGGENILQMSENMGLGTSPSADIPNAKSGNLTALEDTEWAGIGNLSIGQGELLSTPLQIARLTNIIANGGIDTGVYLIRQTSESIETIGWQEKYPQWEIEQEKRIISQETVSKLTEMMVAVMEYGTGNNMGADIATAGKTGSAEVEYAKGKVVHGWFTGFFPADDPRYTISVFMEDGRSGKTSAVPVFEEICKSIMETEKFDM